MINTSTVGGTYDGQVLVLLHSYRGAGEVYTKKLGSVYRSVYNKYTLLYASTGRLVGVYTSPGRWGAHYTTVHYPPRKKIGSVYVRSCQLSPIQLHNFHKLYGPLIEQIHPDFRRLPSPDLCIIKDFH